MGKREFTRMVSECLTVCGVRMSKPESVARGQGWIFFSGSSVVFVVLDSSGELSVESPVVLVPVSQRTPLFRSLLELNVRALGAARFCLRVDRVVLKFSDRVENVAPPKLMSVLREVALAADHFDNLLSHRFSAPMVGPELKKNSAQPWQLLGAPVQLSLSAERSRPQAAATSFASSGSRAREPARSSGPQFEAQRDDRIELAPPRSSGSEFEPPPPDDEVIELARDPYAGRRNPAEPMLARMRGALATAARLAPVEGGLFSILVLRANALWGRGLMPIEAQSVPSVLLLALGEHVERLPEVAPRQGVPRNPTAAMLEAFFTDVVQREGDVNSPVPEGRVFPLSPFRGDQARAHVRKFMSLMTRCPKDDEARTLLFEGALCEMLIRASPLVKEVEERVVRALLEPAPPSTMRVHELQNFLTRSWP